VIVANLPTYTLAIPIASGDFKVFGKGTFKVENKRILWWTAQSK